MSTKLSVLLLYRRIFTQQKFRIAIDTVIGVCVAWAVALLLATLFQCQPISKAWIPDLGGTCIDLQKLYYGTSISNLILDVVINLMPVREIWKLQINRRQKIVLMVIMTLGLV